jgi:hypothetical protein
MIMLTLLAQAPTGAVGVGSATAPQTYSDAVVGSLAGLWAQFAIFLPNLIAAIIVFFVGWALAVAAGRLVEKLLVVLRVNSAFENLKGLKDAAQRAGLHVNIPLLLGEIVKWFLVIVTLLAATDILGLQEISGFLTAVLLYIPNVAVAALILIISVVLSNFVYRTVVASIEAAGFGSANAIAAMSKWAIIIFAILAALTQLNVATTLIQTIVTALFAMLALAGGLAFGLGGRDLAAKWLKKFDEDISGRNKK